MEQDHRVVKNEWQGKTGTEGDTESEITKVDEEQTRQREGVHNDVH